jgi:ADP-ribose pyrophosphatase YjhB (NUDIX family)
MNPEYNLRVGVNAVIIEQEQILLVEFNDDSGLHYNFPGGGIQPGETAHEALQREVFEETQAHIEIDRLLITYEYEPTRLKNSSGALHKLGLFFSARLQSGNQPVFPQHPDAFQTGVKWIPLSDLENILLLPKIHCKIFQSLKMEHPIDYYHLQS